MHSKSLKIKSTSIDSCQMLYVSFCLYHKFDLRTGCFIHYHDIPFLLISNPASVFNKRKHKFSCLSVLPSQLKMSVMRISVSKRSLMMCIDCVQVKNYKDERVLMMVNFSVLFHYCVSTAAFPFQHH